MFCIQIKSKLKGLLREFDKYVDAHIDTALKITTNLKKILASPIADVITAIIPGNVDDLLREQLIQLLDKAIGALAIADYCRQHDDERTRLDCFIQHLSHRDPQMQDALLQKLASLLAGALDGNRLKQSLYDLYTQAKYAATK